MSTLTQSRPLVQMGKRYTAEGRPVRILCVDRDTSSDSSEYKLPVVALHEDGYVRTHFADGRYYRSVVSRWDLEEVKVPLTEAEDVWVPFWRYPNGKIYRGTGCPTEERARSVGRSTAIKKVAVVKYVPVDAYFGANICDGDMNV